MFQSKNGPMPNISICGVIKIAFIIWLSIPISSSLLKGSIFRDQIRRGTNIQLKSCQLQSNGETIEA